MHTEVLWETYRDDMTHDTRFRRQEDGGSLEDAYNDALLLLVRKLNLSNKSLREFPDMPLAVLPAGPGQTFTIIQRIEDASSVSYITTKAIEKDKHKQKVKNKNG
ncbi:hypothetical protein PsorP6_015356 [Peronosclerospora sorghi]|uniref:Uncharacterized protein n=1 Tax=Peronosclerospora sorghi TaxID=230839 RepID=A0ACC0WP71_9STRA|nr:hypothetical protein PsorP6_015356 [Peronosclerospora sorghi]